jgi:choline dehydrogenase-like flavoprotein
MTVDTIIIGSGVAASAISQRLLEKDPKASILMLEAGTRVKTRDFALWENYLITGRLPYEPFRDLEYPQKDARGENANVGRTEVPLNGARVFAYGGSTHHWGGWSFRLKPEDFRLRSNTGKGADWPISFDDIEPYYCKAEDYLAVSGDSTDKTVPRSADYPFQAFPPTLEDQPLAQALDKLGISRSSMPIARRGSSKVPSRHAPCQTTGTCKYCPFGARYVASNYLDDIREWNDYPNFQVRLGAIVETIWSSAKQTVAGVEYTDTSTGKTERVEANRIIVAAGTIESAKLLQRSLSSDWPCGLGNGSDMVGRHFITHPYFIYTGQMKANPLKLQPEMNFPTLISRHFDSKPEQPAGKFLLVNPPDPVPVSLVGKMQSGFSRKELGDFLTGPLPMQLHGMVEVFGEPQNRIENLNRRNHLGLLETSVNYGADQAFPARMDAIKAEVRKIYQAMNADLSADASVSWRADHAASTCRMSADAATGVVDPDLRVHGIDNLFVCSNAVFPSLGAVNPTLTLTALALRLGDHLNSMPR